ncbi:MAG: PfkB family carbohydrate kinase [Ahrensia sp.]|nr:PfkB family carbohydrate kinase [Ahrensia sp.]
MRRQAENQIAVIAGANGALKPEQTTLPQIMPHDFVMLQMEIPAVVNFAAIDQAHTAGAISVLNIAPFNNEAVKLAKHADIIIANETEFDALADAMGLVGNGFGERAAGFASATGRTIIITLGAKGAIGASRDGVFTADAPKIIPVDTVGAGDTFCGAFTVALSEGKGLAEAMHFGCVAGALACLKHGAQPAIPYREEIDALISNI